MKLLRLFYFHSRECYCDNSYGVYGIGNLTDCNMPCSGNNQQICGGRWRNSIYRI